MLINRRFLGAANFRRQSRLQHFAMHFSGLEQAIIQQIGWFLCAFRHSGRTSEFSDRKSLAGQHQIGEAKQFEQLRSVFGQAAIARLPMAKQVLDDMKRMLNFRSHKKSFESTRTLKNAAAGSDK